VFHGNTTASKPIGEKKKIQIILFAFSRFVILENNLQNCKRVQYSIMHKKMSPSEIATYIRERTYLMCEMNRVAYWIKFNDRSVVINIYRTIALKQELVRVHCQTAIDWRELMHAKFDMATWRLYEVIKELTIAVRNQTGIPN